MKTILVSMLILLSISAYSEKKVKLFNGKNLNNWDLFVNDNTTQPESVFTVEKGVIKVSGKPNGYLRTKEVYTNYELHVEWRWAAEPSNSGVLLHVNGFDFWPNCIEAQLMNSKAGDLVLIGYGTAATIADSAYINTKSRYTVLPKFEESNEKNAGEWNSYDIICKGDKVTIYVNGTLQNAGLKLSHTGGSIGLQSEGSPIEFRNIFLKRMDN